MSSGYLTLSHGNSSVTFTRFSDTEVPGSYMAQASLEFSQIGTAYASGPARRQRKMWSVSAFITAQQWQALKSVYESWDSKRAEGSNLAAASLTDGLMGFAESFEVFFTEPPSLSKLSPSNNTDFLTTFVVTET